LEWPTFQEGNKQYTIQLWPTTTTVTDYQLNTFNTAHTAIIWMLKLNTFQIHQATS